LIGQAGVSPSGTVERSGTYSGTTGQSGRKSR
jgi:hypothetical protein